MILLMRHGETFWNREGRIQGHTESDLTPLGERQARAMAGLVADLVRHEGGRFRLISSPIGRARRTAAMVAEATGLPIEIDARLSEICCGDGRAASGRRSRISTRRCSGPGSGSSAPRAARPSKT